MTAIAVFLSLSLMSQSVKPAHAIIVHELSSLDESHGRKFNPGDRIIIPAGTYHCPPINLYSAGTKNHPITLMAAPGTEVTIKGSGKETMISIQSGADYWRIDGLKFKSDMNLKLIDAYRATGLILHNCQLGPVPGNGCCARLSQCNEAVIDECGIAAVSLTLLKAPLGLSSDGLIIDNSNGCAINNCQFGDCGHVALNIRNSGNNVVTGNTVSNRLHTGIAIINIPGNPGISRGNLVQENTIKSYNTKPSYPDSPGMGVEILYAGGNRIIKNVIQDGSSDATGLSIAADPSVGTCSDNIVSNNTFYMPGARGIEIGNFGSIGKSNGVSGNVISKNIIAGIPVGGSRTAPVVLKFFAFEKNNGYGNEIVGNLLSSDDGVLTKLSDENANLQSSYRLADLVKTGWGVRTISCDPKFVSAGRDFHLRPGSKAETMGAYPTR